MPKETNVKHGARGTWGEAAWAEAATWKEAAQADFSVAMLVAAG
jgi:hypothetical protein